MIVSKNNFARYGATNDQQNDVDSCIIKIVSYHVIDDIQDYSKARVQIVFCETKEKYFESPSLNCMKIVDIHDKRNGDIFDIIYDRVDDGVDVVQVLYERLIDKLMEIFPSFDRNDFAIELEQPNP